MIDANFTPGPYTLGKLGHELRAHALEATRWLPHLRLPAGEGLEWGTRLAVQLRLAKLLGCPVCLKLFPPLGPRAGLTDDAVGAALQGEGPALSPEAAAAVAWIEAVIVGDGTAPAEVPAAAAALTPAQRNHLLAQARLEIVIHSVGLMFLPHRVVERAFRG
ncbi:MAG TPA: hypothetical protein VGQ83_13825 [Polyangia bacterium]|jgi:alkylhydroperoxidase family enzyme